MKKEKNYLLFLVLWCALLITVNSYSILGKWKLSIDDRYQNITKDQTIVFNFQKNVQNGTIVHALTVYACSIIQFQYIIDDNLTSFVFKKIGVNRQQCVKDEVNEIITKAQKVTYTLTVGSTLIFLSPTGKILFSLSPILQQNIKSLSGVWQISETQQQETNTFIKANNTVIQLCEGQATIDYNIPKSGKLLTAFRSVKGCSQSLALTSLYKAKYFRKFSQDQLWFYGQQGLLMKWKSLGYIDGQLPIKFSSAVVRIINIQQKSTISNIQTTNNTQISKQTPKVTQSVKVIQPSPSAKPSQVNTLPPPASPSITPPAAAPINNSKPLITIPPPSSAAPVVPPPLVLSIVIAPPPSMSPVVTPPPPPSILPAVLASVPSPPIGSAVPLQKQKVYGKYFPSNSSEQMILFTAIRIMIYGDCGVWFTPITYGQADTDKVQITSKGANNTSPQCLGKGSPFQNLINSIAYAKLTDLGRGSKTLSILGKNKEKLTEWSSIKKN